MKPMPLDGWKNTGEVVFSIALFLFSLGFMWQATLVPDPPRNVIVGPQTVPLILGGLMAMTSALLIFRAVRTAMTGEGDPEIVVVGEPEIEETPIGDWPGVIAVVISLAALFALLEPLGFVVSMTMFLFTLSTIFSPRRWLINLIVAAGFSLFFYWVFTDVLEVSLPPGDILPAIFGVTG